VFVDREDGTLVVSVRDDGKGFSLDESALAAADKAGILRSMKGRIEDMGGSIVLSSTPGRGTEVEFRIPGLTARSGTHRMTEPIRVMVADDHPVWRNGLRTDLESSGVATVVAEAGDGGDAIEQAREAMPEVVVMDLQLPTVSGIEATRQIVADSPHIRILVLSASP
jgi:hypothetical protein